MIDKTQSKNNMRQTKINLGAQITQLRKSKALTIEHLGFECGMTTVWVVIPHSIKPLDKFFIGHQCEELQ